MKKIFENAIALKENLPVGERFTLVGGCFDLIHVGHIHLLEYASTLEDRLVVAVLSDISISAYKGPMRPVISQKQRAQMVASIRYVDWVYISDTSPSDPETLKLLKPNSVIFGQETTSVENIRRWSARINVHSPHTKIYLLPRYTEEEVSTSYIIRKVQSLPI